MRFIPHREAGSTPSPKTTLAALCAVVLSFAPATAAARGPSSAGYAEPGANVLPQSGTLGSSEVADSNVSNRIPASGPGAQATVGEARTTRSARSGSLPFTGADVTLAALAGVILLALGLALRRSTHDSG